MNQPVENMVRQLMALVCNANSLADSLKLFKEAGVLLAKCKFVFASFNGGTPGFAVNREFSKGAVVRSLFNTEKILVLDKDTVREMETQNGNVTYPIDYSISLDTQALSYLEPYLKGRTTKIPKDFQEVFEFIARDDVYVDPLPYLQENLSNLNALGASEKIFEKLKAYEVLRTLDTEWLHKNQEVRSKLSEQELIKRTQEHIARMYRSLDEKAFMDSIELRHQTMYCLLLKMAIIQLGSSNASIIEKMKLFIEFCDAELATIFGREIAIARAYFERGQGLTFFGKIQSGKPDIFRTLNGMAWDLWHVRQMEESMTLKPSHKARYFFPAFLTFDKRLIEVIDLYPLRACAYIEGDRMPMPFYALNWFDLVADTEEEQKVFKNRFYAESARTSRDERRSSCEKQLTKTVFTLEQELSNIAGVPKQTTAF